MNHCSKIHTLDLQESFLSFNLTKITQTFKHIETVTLLESDINLMTRHHTNTTLFQEFNQLTQLFPLVSNLKINNYNGFEVLSPLSQFFELNMPHVRRVTYYVALLNEGKLKFVKDEEEKLLPTLPATFFLQHIAPFLTEKSEAIANRFSILYKDKPAIKYNRFVSFYPPEQKKETESSNLTTNQKCISR